MQYFLFELDSTVAESEPHSSHCPSPSHSPCITCGLHTTCAYAHASPWSLFSLHCATLRENLPTATTFAPDPKAHLYHGSVPQPSSFKQHHAVNFHHLLGEAAVWPPNVLYIQYLGPHVYPPEASQILLKTTPAVRVAAVRAQGEFWWIRAAEGTSVRRSNIGSGFDRTLQRHQRCRRSASACSRIRVRTVIFIPSKVGYHKTA